MNEIEIPLKKKYTLGHFVKGTEYKTRSGNSLGKPPKRKKAHKFKGKNYRF